MAANNDDNGTSSAALNALKAACSRKNFVSFKDLSPGEYIVNNFSIMDTAYGERLRVEMPNAFMYLPPSVLKQLNLERNPGLIDDLNKAPKIMVYKGKDADNHNAIMLDFNEVSYFENEMFGLLTPKS